MEIDYVCIFPFNYRSFPTSSVIYPTLGPMHFSLIACFSDVCSIVAGYSDVIMQVENTVSDNPCQITANVCLVKRGRINIERVKPD